MFNGLREVRGILEVRLILFVFVKVVRKKSDRLLGEIIKELDETFMEHRNIQQFDT
jgi:hypothetical protein